MHWMDGSFFNHDYFFYWKGMDGSFVSWLFFICSGWMAVLYHDNSYLHWMDGCFVSWLFLICIGWMALLYHDYFLLEGDGWLFCMMIITIMKSQSTCSFSDWRASLQSEEEEKWFKLLSCLEIFFTNLCSSLDCIARQSLKSLEFSGERLIVPHIFLQEQASPSSSTPSPSALPWPL